MNKLHTYIAEAGGQSTMIFIEDRAESIANTEAKIEVERWLRATGRTPRDLTRFDLLATTPV